MAGLHALAASTEHTGKGTQVVAWRAAYLGCEMNCRGADDLKWKFLQWR